MTTSHPKFVVLKGEERSIYTVDPNQPWAEIVVFSKITGIINFVGSLSKFEIFLLENELQWKDMEIIEIGKGFVLPGFQDAHVHPLTAGIMEKINLNLSIAESLEETLQLVQQYIEFHPTLAPYIGWGWGSFLFPPYGIPSCKILDVINSHKPILLTRFDGHSMWVNSKAMELAGITQHTPDPSNGRIDRNEHGIPIGSFHESATELFNCIIPSFPISKRIEGLKYALRKMISLGITAFQEALVRGSNIETYEIVYDEMIELLLKQKEKKN